MQVLLAWLVRSFSWALSSIVGDNLLRFVAGKAILTGLFVVILPVILNNFIYDIMNLGLSWLNNSNPGFQSINGGMSYSGLAAYLAGLLKIPDCVSVLVSALVLRITLNHIPFLRI